MNDGGALRVAAARSSGMAMQPSPLATSLTRVALDAGHPAASSPLLVSKGNVGDAVTTLNSNPNPTQSMTRADPTIPQFKKKKKKKKRTLEPELRSRLDKNSRTEVVVVLTSLSSLSVWAQTTQAR
eukprot:m.321871 g.321871  ORF g.321871 m.321871 type:complete len:126 (-) comp27594_c3_seq11:6167-6544(-)